MINCGSTLLRMLRTCTHENLECTQHTRRPRYVAHINTRRPRYIAHTTRPRKSTKLINCWSTLLNFKLILSWSTVDQQCWIESTLLINCWSTMLINIVDQQLINKVDFPKVECIQQMLINSWSTKLIFSTMLINCWSTKVEFNQQSWSTVDQLLLISFNFVDQQLIQSWSTRPSRTYSRQGSRFGLVDQLWINCWSTCWFRWINSNTQKVDQHCWFHSTLLINSWSTLLIVGPKIQLCWSTVDQQSWMQSTKLINSWSTCWFQSWFKLINCWSTSWIQPTKLINCWSTMLNNSTKVDQLLINNVEKFNKSWSTVDQHCWIQQSWSTVDQQVDLGQKINMLINSWSTMLNSTMLINCWFKVDQQREVGTTHLINKGKSGPPTSET